MIIETIASLVQPDAISSTRLQQALDGGAPIAVARCADHTARCSRKELEQAISSRLQDCLAIGIPDKILRDWWSRNRRTGGNAGLLDIDLLVQSAIGRRIKGVTVLSVTIQAVLRLTQQGSHCTLHDSGCGVMIGENRAWHADLKVSLHDTPASPPDRMMAPVFFERRCDVYLPPQPWPAPT